MIPQRSDQIRLPLADDDAGHWGAAQRTLDETERHERGGVAVRNGHHVRSLAIELAEHKTLEKRIPRA